MTHTIASIKAAVCRQYQVRESDMISRRYLRGEISQARQMAMALARRLTKHSRTTIGHHFADRDPTTVLYAERVTVERYIADPAVEAAISDILRTLGSVRDWDA